MKKLLRKTRHNRVCSVLIVKPHKIECQTNEWTSQFVMKAFQRGTAELAPFPTKLPEFGRNTGIEKFLHDPKHKHYEHIFFLDDDSPPFDEHAIEYLRAQNKNVIAGVTPIVLVKPDKVDCHWSAAIEDESGAIKTICINELPKKPFKAHRVGGTCLLVHRRVLEKLKPPYQKTTFNDTCTDVKLSEDVYFVDKIRQAGFDIWVDPKVQCHHWHMFDLADIFAIVRQTKCVSFS